MSENASIRTVSNPRPTGLSSHRPAGFARWCHRPFVFTSGAVKSSAAHSRLCVRANRLTPGKSSSRSNTSPGDHRRESLNDAFGHSDFAGQGFHALGPRADAGLSWFRAKRTKSRSSRVTPRCDAIEVATRLRDDLRTLWFTLIGSTRPHPDHSRMFWLPLRGNFGRAHGFSWRTWPPDFLIDATSEASVVAHSRAFRNGLVGIGILEPGATGCDQSPPESHPQSESSTDVDCNGISVGIGFSQLGEGCN